jgi:hypothetical protein
MISLKGSPVLEATTPSEEEKFYIEWGRETIKNNLIFANEVLRELVTLNSALLGGSIAFLDDTMLDPTLKPIVVALFLLSLIVSFLGIMPYESFVDLRVPDQIQQHKRRALRWKRRFLWTAGGLIALSFTVAITGLKIG